MVQNIKIAVIILSILPLYLLGENFSIRVGANHSWLYYPDEFMVKIAENEFNPDFSIGLNASVFSKGSFSGSYGIRFFSVGRFDKLQFDNIKREVEMKHLYLSIPLQLSYTIISKFVT